MTSHLIAQIKGVFQIKALIHTDILISVHKVWREPDPTHPCLRENTPTAKAVGDNIGGGLVYQSKEPC